MHLLGQDDLRRRATERTRYRHAAPAAHRSGHFGRRERVRTRSAHRVGALEDRRVRRESIVANGTVPRRCDGRDPRGRCRRLGDLGLGVPFRALPRFWARRCRLRRQGLLYRAPASPSRGSRVSSSRGAGAGGSGSAMGSATGSGAIGAAAAPSPFSSRQASTNRRRVRTGHELSASTASSSSRSEERRSSRPSATAKTAAR